MHRVTRLKALAACVVVSLCALFVATPTATAAELSIENVLVDYITQTTTSATGTVTFDVVFSGLGGDPGNYDRAAIQVLIARTLDGAGSDVFSLCPVETEDTAAIGSSYWLSAMGTPTGNELASTEGDEFYFGDFISPNLGVTPSLGDVIGRYVVGFIVDEPVEFATYSIARGDETNNEFGVDLFESYSNTITPKSFQIERLPEPSTVILLAAGFGTLMLRRRRI